MNLVHQRPSSRESGLTALEILLLLMIFAVAGALLFPQILARVDDARLQGAHSDLERIGLALERYRLDNQVYPSNEQGLQALVEKPESDPVPSAWNPDGYLKRGKVPTDPWGNPYQYEHQGIGSFQLFSLGADGKVGGEGYDADIYYTPPHQAP